METESKLPMQASRLIPHRKPMRLVDRLIEFKDQSGAVEAVVTPENGLTDSEGRLDQLAVAEMMAQAYATVKGYADRLSGKPATQGYLVGIRQIQFFASAYAGDRLRINVDTVGTISGFAVVEGQVRRSQEVIARGRIKLWIPEHFSAEPDKP
ncbi:MAG: hypothetical protein JSW39_09880 [Desulfobacterales bacterium]|nr:MAG: hypothetical protein JSW39_09880 [Desulfobacterales bacterium]